MDFITDNAVALSAIFLGVVVLAALAVLALAALKLWRRARSAQKRIDRESQALTAQTERLSAAMAAMPERQAELRWELESLQRRVQALKVLADSASEAVRVLRSPLRYFTG